MGEVIIFLEGIFLVFPKNRGVFPPKWMVYGENNAKPLYKWGENPPFKEITYCIYFYLSKRCVFQHWKDSEIKTSVGELSPEAYQLR